MTRTVPAAVRIKSSAGGICLTEGINIREIKGDLHKIKDKFIKATGLPTEIGYMKVSEPTIAGAVDILKDSSKRFSFFNINSDVNDNKVNVNYSLVIDRAPEVYSYLLKLEKIEGLTYKSSKEDALKAYKDRGYVCIENN